MKKEIKDATEAVVWRCSVEKVFLKNSQNSRPPALLKMRLWHRCFPVNFAKFLRTPFLQNTSGWLLLFILSHIFVSKFDLVLILCSTGGLVYTGLRPATLLKKRLQHRCFLVSFLTFLRTSFYRTSPGDCFFKVTFPNLCYSFTYSII